MIEELSPFGAPALTVAGSVYEHELPCLWSYTEERQGFRPTLQTNHLVAVCREARGGTHTGLRLEATNLFRCITEFSSVDLPTFARPVEGGLGLACMPHRRRIGRSVHFFALRTCYNNLFQIRCIDG
jgi:hypothetical protein